MLERSTSVARLHGLELPLVIEVEPDLIELNAPSKSSDWSYRALNAHTLIEYLAGRDGIARRLGGSPERRQADERGDGNLNLVFVVTGVSGALVVKQALPYVHMVGPSWPLQVARELLVERTALGSVHGLVDHVRARL